MSQRAQHILDAALLTVGSMTGLTAFLQDIDLLMGILLKGISIVSFVLVIVINWEKAIMQIKQWFR